jgi:adenine/guanine phosphoribosyltransferase-like PRPP-binding protein
MFRIVRKGINILNRVMGNSENRLLSELYILKENMTIPCTYKPLTFTLADTLTLCKSLSSDFDIVVAIPRSGMIVGSIIATVFGKPLTTPDVLAEGRVWMSEKNGYCQTITENTRLLLVDDGVQNGTAFRKAVSQIREKYPEIKIKTAVLYAHAGAKEMVDIYLEEVSGRYNNYCDYSIMHCKPKKVAFDLDGVLCEDSDCNNTPVQELNQMIHGNPFKIPEYEIDCIITARLERFRGITETWLASNGVKYKKLYMRQHGWENVLDYKSEILLKEKPILYVESDQWIAKECQERTGVRCLCLTTGTLYG